MTILSMDTKQITFQSCFAVSLPTEGRVCKRGRRSFDENCHEAWRVANLKEWKHNGVKRANPAFCSQCLLLWGLHKVRCDFLNAANEKKLDFHRPADLLRAGVSQIQFQFFFLSSSCTLPSWRYCRPIQVLLKIYIKANQGFSWVSVFFIFFFKEFYNHWKKCDYCDWSGYGNLAWKPASITQVYQLCFFHSHLTVSIEFATEYEERDQQKAFSCFHQGL